MKLMKGIAIILSVFMVAGFMFACDTGDDTDTISNNNQQNNEFDEMATVQGTVFDATTGERLAGDVLESLDITMIMGTSYKSPAMLKNNGSDTETVFDGDFAFTNVPVTMWDLASYRIVATADGYQQFEGYFSLDTDGYYPTADEDGSDGNNNTIDTVYNFIGNVYLFPLGATAPEINVYVYFDQEPVAGATVQLEQLIGSNLAITNTINAWSPDSGLLPSLSATTDATGLATFAGSSLVLGGEYDIDVLPIVYEGVQLSLTDGANITVGTDTHTVAVSMSDLEPGNDDEGLYVTDASNYDADDLQSDGVLTVEFNRSVWLVDADAPTATFTTSDGVSDPAGSGALEADSVTATMSADGKTLTLTPNFNPSPDADDADSQVNYANVQVTLYADEENQVYNIFALEFADGVTNLSNVVNVKKP